MIRIIKMLLLLLIIVSCSEITDEHLINLSSLPDPEYPDLTTFSGYEKMNFFINERVQLYMDDSLKWNPPEMIVICQLNPLAYAINDYLWTHYEYMTDNDQFGEDKWQTPIQFLEGHYDDCEGFTLAFMYLVYWYTNDHPYMEITKDPDNGNTNHSESTYKDFNFYDIEEYTKHIKYYSLHDALKIAQYIGTDTVIID